MDVCESESERERELHRLVAASKPGGFFLKLFFLLLLSDDDLIQKLERYKMLAFSGARKAQLLQALSGFGFRARI